MYTIDNVAWCLMFSVVILNPAVLRNNNNINLNLTLVLILSYWQPLNLVFPGVFDEAKSSFIREIQDRIKGWLVTLLQL